MSDSPFADVAAKISETAALEVPVVTDVPAADPARAEPAVAVVEPAPAPKREPAVVSRTKYENATKEAAAAQEQLATLTAENAAIKSQIAQLMAKQNPEQAQAVAAESTSQEDWVDNMLAELSKGGSELEPAMVNGFKNYTKQMDAKIAKLESMLGQHVPAIQAVEYARANQTMDTIEAEFKADCPELPLDKVYEIVQEYADKPQQMRKELDRVKDLYQRLSPRFAPATAAALPSKFTAASRLDAPATVHNKQAEVPSSFAAALSAARSSIIQ